MANYLCSIDRYRRHLYRLRRDGRGGTDYDRQEPLDPDDFSRGFFNALEVAAERLGTTLGELVRDTSLLFHGTTVGTNAIINLNGAKTGLITTRGHADALLIMRVVGRSAGLPISELLRISHHQKPRPIIPRALIREVSERVDWKGSTVLPLNEGEAELAIE